MNKIAIFLLCLFILNSCSRPHGCEPSQINLIADGNSYVHGDNSAMQAAYTPFPTLIGTTLGIAVQNYSMSGQTTEEMINDESSQILTTYIQGKINVLIAVEGGNDIHLHLDANAAYENTKNYCKKARARGFKVLVATAIYRNNQYASADSTNLYNKKLDQYNNLLLSDHSFYDRIIRPDLESIFSTFTSGGYDDDGVHPNQLGQQKYADLCLAFVKNACDINTNN